MTEATTALKAPRPSFAALRHSGFRPYLIGNALVMTADSVEHVISYWAMYQKFHSPALGGFAVISHWVPFLVFGVWVGALSDRFDPRRIIQIGMVLFMLCSLSWAVLFHLGWLAEWHAVAILTVHGIAALFWNPASQVLIHHIVGPEDLSSAVQLMATSRYLGLFAGPAVGGAILLALGRAAGSSSTASAAYAVADQRTLWPALPQGENRARAHPGAR